MAELVVWGDDAALKAMQRADAVPARQRTMLNKLNKDFQFVLRRFQQLAAAAGLDVSGLR